MNRSVAPELLDQLPPRDPRAERSRRDLQRLNTWMGHPAIMARALESAWNGKLRRRIVELGAGDGHFLFQVARRWNGRWRNGEAVLVDRLDAFDPQSQPPFDRWGWQTTAQVADALDWLRNGGAQFADAIISNLLLHQFHREQITELFCLASRASRVFIAIEPRRAWWPLFCSRFLRLAGCGPVTRHDAVVSVRAGFREAELSALWPDAGDWELTERAAGCFSHLFIARKQTC